jgi:hypothetical protein
MMRLDEAALLGDRADPIGPLYRCYSFMEELPPEGRTVTSRTEQEGFRYHPGFHHVALLDLFGLIELEEDPQEGDDGWRIRRVAPRPFGKALMKLTAGLYQSAFEDETGRSRWGPDELKERIRLYFPAWRNDLSHPLSGFRDGVFVFKVSLGDGVWRRIAAPARVRLNGLAHAILKAFAFDRDHLDRFAFKDPFGLPAEVNHPYLEEPPFTDEVRVGDVPLREGQRMSYVFDFGDWWEFDLLLERIEPKKRLMRRPVLLQSHGEAPEQYPGYEDDEEDEQDDGLLGLLGLGDR